MSFISYFKERSIKNDDDSAPISFLPRRRRTQRRPTKALAVFFALLALAVFPTPGRGEQTPAHTEPRPFETLLAAADFTKSAAERGAQTLLDGLVGLSRTLDPRKTPSLPTEDPRYFPVRRYAPRGLLGKSCSVKFVAVGDILIHDTMRAYSKRKEGGYDFKPNFQYVRPIFKKADLVIGNLENPLAGEERRLSGYPNFNAPQELAGDLKESGFTTVLIANNHSMDRSWAGLAQTIETVEAAGLDYVGAYRDPQDKKRRLIAVYNGLKIATLAYTYGLNGYPGPKPDERWRLGVIDQELIWSDLKAVQDEGVDFIILSLHFGNEYERKPNKIQTALVAELLAGDPERGLAGPDLILGHHPHVVQPFVQIEKGPGLSNQAVMYSLGNFMTSQPFPHTFLGLILTGELSVGPDGRKTVGPFTLIPTYCHKGVKDGKKYYRVIPMARGARDPESFGLTAATGKLMERYYQELTTHLVSMEPDSSKWPNFE
ncbi:MAG: CapA family protein [Deltaproteobacteria bacterium]|jgi:poly-gamma-glutamate synthesis protein (capsule biosynthesis protein)|nr:CapA family protein [Deltaproteobacteria bacterium]